MLRFWKHLAAVTVVMLSSTALSFAQDSDVLLTESFEKGNKAPEGWKAGAEIPGVKYVYDRKAASEGERSLGFDKTANRYFPIAQWHRVLEHKGNKPSLKVSAKVKAMNVTKAIVAVHFLDANGDLSHQEWVVYIGQKEDTDPVATHDWKVYEGAVAIPNGTKQIAIALQDYGPGKVWFDELELRYVDPNAAAKEGETPKAPLSSASPANAAEMPEPIEIKTEAGGVAQYFLIPPSDGAEKPASGYPVLLVLPGGDGSAEFHPFICRIHEQALNGKYVIAQPVAPGHFVWPTTFSTTFCGTTEQSIEAIIADVAERQQIDRQKVYALAWSSSGPAVYASLLQDDSPLAGALIAMSVFQPKQLPPLENAADSRIYLLHSPEDEMCPYWMARAAKEQLGAVGAAVTLVDYAGGHGWHGPIFEQIRTGMDWLQSDTTAPR